IEAWLGQGSPTDKFVIQGGGPVSTTKADYTFTPAVGAALTNLGSCILDKEGFETAASGVMEAMDTFFATATSLPDNIADTDLTSFDSEILTSTGVVAYVPTYPLWSDGSGKLRHIRVPKGQTVKFDKDKQTFDIPENTRFYKTFFREVIDKAGVVSHRKMETRLIVARAASPPDKEGVVKQNALFGTYIWSEDETTATLSAELYRDHTPFTDQVREYITDELSYEELVESFETVGALSEKDRLKKIHDAAVDAHLVQHYAIPGRIRCDQCHQGSPSQDFVLG